MSLESRYVSSYNNEEKIVLFYSIFWEKVFLLFFIISDKSSVRSNDVFQKIEELIEFVKSNLNQLSSPIVAILLDVVIQVNFLHV